MKDPEKSHAQSHKSYMKDPEKSRADSAARSHGSYKKDLEKSCDNSAARSRESYFIGVGTGGHGWATAPPPIFCYVLRSLQLSKTDV